MCTQEVSEKARTPAKCRTLDIRSTRGIDRFHTFVNDLGPVTPPHTHTHT